MMRVTRHLLCVTLILSLLVSAVSMTAFAAEKDALSAERGVIEGSWRNPLYPHAPVKAQNHKWGDKIEEPSENVFNPNRDTIVARLKESLQNHKSEIYLYHRTGMMLSEAYLSQMLLEAVNKTEPANWATANMGDYIQFNITNVDFHVEYAELNGVFYNIIVYQISYLTTQEQEQAAQDKAIGICNELNQQAHNDYQKAKLIYDYLLKNVSYDLEHAVDPNYLLQHSPYGALIDGKASAQGFAMTFYYMAAQMGLDCRIVLGTVDEEIMFAWNLVKVYDKWYYVDAAAEAIVGTEDDYFLKCMADIPDHKLDPAFADPEYNVPNPPAKTSFDPSNVAGGELENGLSWRYDAALEAVVISGNGPMQDFAVSYDEYGWSKVDVPWYEFSEGGIGVIVEEGVTSIGANAFWSAAPWKIQIASTVTTIGEGAFRYASFNSIDLPAGLTEIGKEAFYDADIEEITIPDSVTKMGENAFEQSYLKKINIPAALTDVGAELFNLKTLTEIHVAEGHPVYSSYKGVLYNADGTRLIRVPAAYSEPFEFADTVTAIEAEAFRDCEKVVALAIPEGVTEIGANAFQNCGVKTVTLPATMTKIGDEVFRYAGELQCIYVPATVTEIGSHAFIDYRHYTLVYSGTRAQWNKVKLADGAGGLYYGTVKTDGNEIFMNPYTEGSAWKLNMDTGALEWTDQESGGTWAPWKDLVKSVTIKADGWVNKIPDSTFAGYENLESISIAATVTEIGDGICAGCDKLKEVIYLGDKLAWSGMSIGANNENIKELVQIKGKVSFADVAEKEWYYNPVMWAVENNVTGGIGNGKFGPNNSCTRAQVVTFLYAAAGKPEVTTTDNPFEDVADNAWYLKPVLWAVENGITSGIDATHFGPDKTCTRAQVVTFLYAAAGKPEITASSDFNDVKDSDWFAKPVIWAKVNDVTGGVSEGMFGPNQTCTRAQVVTFLYKVYADK